MTQGPSYWFDTRIYLGVVAALLTIIAFYNYYIAVLGAILLVALYMYGRERYRDQQKVFSDYTEAMVSSIGQSAAYAVGNLPLAMALVDEQERLHWCNDLFSQWSGNKARSQESIRKLWPELPIEHFWSKSGRERLQIADRYYQIIYRPVEHDGDQQLTALYIADITSSETLRVECSSAMPVLIYIQIDNMDDVLQGLTETQRTNIFVEVGRTLSQWIEELDGIVKKHAKDTYLAVISRQALDTALADKFEILDRIRAIEQGNRIPVTMSMGIAADETSITAMGQRAQAGLDLALGRGGDQVAVYVSGKTHFYGGKTAAVEKNTRVKARVVAQAIRESIDDADAVLVMGHGGEDFDSLGAAMGVAKMARHAKKPVYFIVSQPNPTVNKLMDMVAEYEEYRELVCSPEQAIKLITPKTLVFVVDTHRAEMVAAPDVLKQAEKIIIIDHHRRGEGFVANPLLVYLEPSASSTCELVTELLMYFDDNIELTRLEATVLYAGIVVDTKNFAVQSGVRTFDAASYLRRAGADPVLVRHLFRVDFSTMKARAEIIGTAELLVNGVAIAVCPPGILEAQIAAAQAADVLLRIENVRVSFVLFNLDDGVGICARSQGDINVQVIMEQLGGGGHQTVAGAQIKNAAIADVKRRIIEKCAQYLEESEKE